MVTSFHPKPLYVYGYNPRVDLIKVRTLNHPLHGSITTRSLRRRGTVGKSLRTVPSSFPNSSIPPPPTYNIPPRTFQTGSIRPAPPSTRTAAAAATPPPPPPPAHRADSSIGKQMAQLPPSPQPLGVFRNYIARQTESLVIRERVMSLSGDSFDIKTIDGRDILQVKGEAFSLSGRKSVMDVHGNHLFTIRKEHFTLSRSYYAEDTQGRRFFEVQGKFSRECSLAKIPQHLLRSSTVVVRTLFVGGGVHPG